MSDAIVVDYMGDGNFMQAFHPQMKVTNVFGEIDLPDITITHNNVTYDYPFTLPYPIANPFLKAVEIWGVDCYFVPVDIAAGKWIMRMCGRVVSQTYAGQTTWREVYGRPCTNRFGRKSQILYGGNRG